MHFRNDIKVSSHFYRFNVYIAQRRKPLTTGLSLARHGRSPQGQGMLEK